MGWLYKKSEAATTLLIIIVIVFFLGWIFNVSQRECKTNRDCSSESYCGSDFSCHSYPNIQKTVVQYNLFWPAVIIGIAIVLATWIFKGNSFKFRSEQQPTEKVEAKEPKEVDEITEPYYKSDSNVRTP